MLWVGDIPIPCAVCASCEDTGVGGIPVILFSYCVCKGAPGVTVFKVDEFDCEEVVSSLKVISPTSVGWVRIVVEDDSSFDVFW